MQLRLNFNLDALTTTLVQAKRHPCNDINLFSFSRDQNATRHVISNVFDRIHACAHFENNQSNQDSPQVTMEVSNVKFSSIIPLSQKIGAIFGKESWLSSGIPYLRISEKVNT